MYTRIDNMHKLTYEEAKEIFAKALFQSPETHPIYKEAVEKIDERIEKNGYEIVMKADDDDLQFSGTEYRAYAVVRAKDDEFPQMIYTDAVGTAVYLAPFRGYSFQVSGNMDGDGDYGSTPVVGLNNILDARYGTCKKVGYQSNSSMKNMGRNVLFMMAEYTLRQFEHQGCCGTTVIPTREIFGKGMLNTFIDLCIEWLQK